VANEGLDFVPSATKKPVPKIRQQYVETVSTIGTHCLKRIQYSSTVQVYYTQ